MNSPATASPAITLDRLLGGRLQLRQPARGHRAGTDAVLLAAFARPPAGGSVVDLGAGVGTVGLILALRDPTLRVSLVERDPVLAALARENAAMNGVADRVGVDERDVFEGTASPADLVVCNPPFYDRAEARPSPDASRAGAHHLGGRNHRDWFDAVLRHGRPRGGVAMVHRPDALTALLAGSERRMGGIVLRPVHARSDGPAIRVLLSGTLASKAPLTLLAPLVLHGPDAAFTAEAEAAHRGTPVTADAKKPARGPASRSTP